MAAQKQQPSTVQHLWDRKSCKGKINHPVNLRTEETPCLRRLGFQLHGKGHTLINPIQAPLLLLMDRKVFETTSSFVADFMHCKVIIEVILHLLDTRLSAACRSCSVPVNMQPVHVGGQRHAMRSLSNTNATSQRKPSPMCLKR